MHGFSVKIWPMVGLSQTRPDTVLTQKVSMTTYEKGDLLALASVWGRGSFQIKETVRSEVIHL